MIKTTTFLLTAFLSVSMIASAQEYTVEYSASPYEALVDANLLDESDPTLDGYGSEVYQSIPIGFDFTYHDVTFNTLRVGENGYAIFSIDGDIQSFINIYECPQMNFQDDPSLSPIYYEVSGEVGEQIFKLEFVKSGFANDEEEDDYVNYQLWIYEDCNFFEIHMGEVSIDPEESSLFFNDNSSPFMGYGSNAPYFFYCMAGNPIDPELQDNPLVTLDEVPDSSSVYTFRNCFVNLAEEERSFTSIYPNPTFDHVTFQFSDVTADSELRILNLNGQIVYTDVLPATNTYSLNTEFLSQGIYIVEIESATGVYSSKLVKK